ncbi:glutamate synthase large subunit [Rhabdothermincola sp.]|uniref:glutamate synthase large subunit n=1 Tax=Rhabdothermincola sp. TaxID=2820405 RepID=UPI002FE01CCD
MRSQPHDQPGRRTPPGTPRSSPELPPAQGLYDPRFEHDACGVNFVVHMKGLRSHEIVRMGIGALCNLQHRGALGAEVNTGDGAGILLQVPDRFFRDEVDFDLPAEGQYATGMAFLPRDRDKADEVAKQIEKIAASEGLRVLGWRDVPHDDSMIGESARAVEPTFRQVFLAGDDLLDLALERRVYIVRKRIEHELGPVNGVSGAYFPSLSGRTFVYKGMLTTPQLPEFFPDLTDERVESALALVHSRFSTNTFPSWPLAHPFRYIAHNGEINTVQGNRNWMRAREALLASDLLPGELDRIFPICTPGASDSATFDEALELLHMGGYSLPHAVLMMIPEAWERHESMTPEKKAFYRFHASLMEPWDGPASIAFTDGTVIGAVLDRNGLRPSRYWVTSDDLVIMASEVGVLDVPPERVVQKGRLQPGRMFLVDTTAGRIIGDAEIKGQLARAKPYQAWLDENLVELDLLPQRSHALPSHGSVVERQQTFGYTSEELRLIIEPMARTGAEPIGSMGTDTPLAVLSSRPRLLYDYFHQLFAQVTNPPLDAIREELVTAIGATVGPEGNLLAPGPRSCRQIYLPRPVLDNDELAKIKAIHTYPGLDDFRTVEISCLYPVAEGGSGLRAALDRIRQEASEAIEQGATMLVLSDRGSTAQLAPIPALLATSAVHHHLIREKSRTRAGLVVETGEAREVHHMCLLIGYGAAAVNPYVAFETIEDLIAEGRSELKDPNTAIRNYIKACGKGILKVMSKMGISTVASYTGAQIFEAIGLAHDFVDEFFTGTVSRLGGIGLDELAAEVEARHRLAYPKNPTERAHRTLEVGGEYQWRREGEYHLFNPETVFKLQHATRTRRYEIFKEYTKLVDDQARRLATLRGLFEFREGVREPVPLEEVEPVSEIVKRFSTGAMSYGSISAEAHETLAIAMNRLGARSNTGEGGEDPERFVPLPNGDSKRSAIKQVASGRFGVTAEYLTNADDLQIKMAQGAKPGEGGQLPGHKVYPWIASTRHSTPGVGLISPPPHHDIYSIEDLAQLIHDLKNSNPAARVHVKLVAEVGVGTVAAGVSKAHADVVLISGHDGGTGAAPLTSIKHAGGPWELGLAETQQTLLLNNLRDRIVVQVDGQLKTGRDVVISALLGAEEYGFATAPLVVSGCVMMRVCHLDTCPVGVATQNPELRRRFSGKPEFVVNFFEFIAEEVRELLARLGFRSLDEAIGHSEVLDTRRAVEHWKASGLDLTPILTMPALAEGASRHRVREQDHGLEHALDNELIRLSQPALERGEPVRIELPIRNVNRTVGTMLGHELTKRYGGAGLPDDTITVQFTGSAGQSFGAFVPRGITLRLDGDANDYTGKGLSGGRIIIRPPAGSPFAAEENIIAGNVILYGATGGEMFLRGMVGERFCVRNSGATAVVEGVGDHGCEYMTGGRVVVLGPTGRNFGAGMSGGIAYVHDVDGTFPERLNYEMVDLDPLDETDREWLREIVQRHLDETGSVVAARLLDSWHTWVEQFRKVMPKDYKRVLEAQRRAEEQGEDVLEAIMAAAHG